MLLQHQTPKEQCANGGFAREVRSRGVKAYAKSQGRRGGGAFARAAKLNLAA